MTVLGAGLATLAVLLVADATLTWWVRREVAGRLAEALGAPVDVDVRGWPASLRLPLGRLRSVVVRATDVPAGRTSLRRLEVSLDGVRPGRTAWWTITTASGSFTAHLDRDGFRDLAPLPDAVVDVRLVPQRVRFELPGGVTVPASVSIDDDVVVLVPEVEGLGLLSVLRIAFPLEELPFGATVDDVEVVDGALIVHGTVGALHLGPDRPGAGGSGRVAAEP